MTSDVDFKIVVLGGGGVGKSALTIRFVSGKFEDTYDPTIEDSYRRDATIDGEPVKLDILDTAGQEEFSALRDQWIRESIGFLVVYSITSRESFGELEVFWKLISRIKEDELDKIAIVLAANKCDLENQRKITTEQGRELAEEWTKEGVRTNFYETSALTKVNNETVFLDVVRLLKGAGKGGKGSDKKESNAEWQKNHPQYACACGVTWPPSCCYGQQCECCYNCVIL